MPIEPGQQVASGRNLAMLASIDRFIAQLNIPEKQIKDVLPGQKVLLDTRSSKIEGRVQRIEPAVINSTVQVDVELTGKLPKEARPELTVDGVIEITTIPDTLFVKRPMFSSGFSQSSILLIHPDGSHAIKKSVTFGQTSSQFIQIRGGLREGQQIIVSDVSDWEQHQQILIN